MLKGSENFKLEDLRRKKRGASFFLKDSIFVAKNILGDYLVLEDNPSILAGKIVETEAYLGKDDDASHACGGKVTPRNKVMYAKGGIVYVYLIYGKFWCFNIVVSKEGDPQAVFIRALQPIMGVEVMKKNRGIDDINKLTNGPCRWTLAFGINKKFLGQSITSTSLFISKGTHKSFSIVEAKRVGIEYAHQTKDLPLRFYIKNNKFVSKRGK